MAAIGWTSLISARRIAALNGKTQTIVRYVTRSYLTRHGAGPLPTECAREEINPSIIDRTNRPNPHQQELRFGLFDGPAILKRVQGDLTITRSVLPDAVAEAVVTHLNETNGELKGNLTLSGFTSRFGKAWLSDCPWSIRN